MITKEVRELLESVDVLNPERAYERIGEALQELRQVEAARAKDAELIQQLVDVLWNETETHEGFLRIQDVIEAAAAAGFKPSEK